MWRSLVSARIPLALGLSFGLSLGACSAPSSPPLKLSVATSYESGTCGSAEPSVSSLAPSSLRLSARVKDADGKTLSVCDAMLSSTAGTVAGFDTPEGGKVDLYVEAFDADAKRIATGALIDVDPTQASFPTLRLFEAEQFRCLPKARMNVARAFHTATPLPNGQILFVGGLTTSSDGLDRAAKNEQLFATSTVEIYDPRARDFVAIGSGATARAFHHAALVATHDDGTYDVLVVGGVVPKDPNQAVITLNETSPSPLTDRFRSFRLLSANVDTAAGAELITYDPNASPPAIVSRQAITGPLADAGAALQAGAPLASTGLIVAGGFTYDNAGMPQSLDVTALRRDGAATPTGKLNEARTGAGLVVLSPTSALVVGGKNGTSAPASPFERIGLSNGNGQPYDAADASFPSYFMPTLTLLDDSSNTTQRVLVSSGLQVLGSGRASDPPSGTDVTMQVITWSSSTTLDTKAAALGSGWVSEGCGAGSAHFKPTAFDATTRLPSLPAEPGRVLVTGGTPRSNSGCNDCEDGEQGASCAIAQASVVEVPAQGVGGAVPTITQTGRLQFPRFGHTQTLLEDGTVLIAGGLAHRDGASGATWAVSGAEFWNPARATPPAAIVLNGVSVDPDDPLRDDLARLGYSRAPATQALIPGDDKPAIACPKPQK